MCSIQTPTIAGGPENSTCSSLSSECVWIASNDRVPGDKSAICAPRYNRRSAAIESNMVHRNSGVALLLLNSRWSDWIRVQLERVPISVVDSWPTNSRTSSVFPLPAIACIKDAAKIAESFCIPRRHMVVKEHGARDMRTLIWKYGTLPNVIERRFRGKEGFTC